MTHSSELEIIRFIQKFRNPVWDAFFKFLDLFDRQEFLFVLIPAVWLGKDWKWGLRLFNQKGKADRLVFKNIAIYLRFLYRLI